LTNRSAQSCANNWHSRARSRQTCGSIAYIAARDMIAVLCRWWMRMA
jgi:hypothetical protein